MKKKYISPEAIAMKITNADIMSGSGDMSVEYTEQGSFELSPIYTIDQSFWDF